MTVKILYTFQRFIISTAYQINLFNNNYLVQIMYILLDIAYIEVYLALNDNGNTNPNKETHHEIHH